jgi:hypothetical protein
MLPRHVGIKLRNFHRFVRLARRRLAPEAGRDVSEAAPAGMAHGGT